MRTKNLEEIGWREEIVLPDLSKYKIKVKVDTGARTSALHVSDLEIKSGKSGSYAHFTIHPKQDSSKPAVKCKAKLKERRKVKSSTGHLTVRPVIETILKVGAHSFKTEITLVNRDMMGFRMLLGRKALKGKFLVNVAKSFVQAKKTRKV